MSDLASKFYWNWQRTAALVVLALAAIQFFRANRPEKTSGPSQQARYYTSGKVVDAVVDVPAGDFTAFRIDLNRRARLDGKYWTGNKRSLIEILLINDTDLELWRSGTGVPRIVSTGIVPGGEIHRVLEPGVYHLVFNNRTGRDPRQVQADFSVE